MVVLRCSRWFVGVMALGCLGAGPLGDARAAGGTMLHAEAGYGQATYAFLGESAPTLTRHLLDLEIGFSRAIAAGGALRLGSSLSLMPVAERLRRDDSYALIAFDMLQLAYGGRERPGVRRGLLGPVRARGGLGLVRVSAPVNEIAIGVSAGVGCEIGPLYLGFKGRASRFEVDFEPHGAPPDTKYKLYYAAVVLGLAMGGN